VNFSEKIVNIFSFDRIKKLNYIRFCTNIKKYLGVMEVQIQQNKVYLVRSSRSFTAAFWLEA